MQITKCQKNRREILIVDGNRKTWWTGELKMSGVIRLCIHKIEGN